MACFEARMQNCGDVLIHKAKVTWRTKKYHSFLYVFLIWIIFLVWMNTWKKLKQIQKYWLWRWIYNSNVIHLLKIRTRMCFFGSFYFNIKSLKYIVIWGKEGSLWERTIRINHTPVSSYLWSLKGLTWTHTSPIRRVSEALPSRPDKIMASMQVFSQGSSGNHANVAKEQEKWTFTFSYSNIKCSEDSVLQCQKLTTLVFQQYLQD